MALRAKVWWWLFLMLLLLLMWFRGVMMGLWGGGGDGVPSHVPLIAVLIAYPPPLTWSIRRKPQPIRRACLGKKADIGRQSKNAIIGCKMKRVLDGWITSAARLTSCTIEECSWSWSRGNPSWLVYMTIGQSKKRGSDLGYHVGRNQVVSQNLIKCK